MKVGCTGAWQENSGEYLPDAAWYWGLESKVNIFKVPSLRQGDLSATAQRSKW